MQFPNSDAGQKLLCLSDGMYTDSEPFIQRMAQDFMAILEHTCNASESTISSANLQTNSLYDSYNMAFTVTFYDPGLLSYIQAESDNIIYYAENKKTGKTYTNASESQMETLTGQLRPAGFGYRLHWDGETLNIDKEGYPASSSARFYQLSFPSPDILHSFFPDASDVQIWMAAAEQPVFTPHFYSDQQAYYQSIYFTFLQFQSIVVIFQIAIFLLSTALLLFPYCFFRRSARKAACGKIAGALGKTWIEIKLLAFGLFLFFAILSLTNSFWAFFLIADFWAVYFLILDLRHNGNSIFSKSFLLSIISGWKKSAPEKPFEQKILRRFLIFCLVEVLVVLTGAPLWIPLLMAIPAFFYYRSLRRSALDIGLLLDRIGEIHPGAPAPSSLMPDSPDLRRAAMQLDAIQDGVSTAVEERVRSERMKIELITNVSHDIKTPLTSIIGYVDLLRQETELPEYVKDYITILARKSERLKNMVQDIFDVSKAATGNIDLQWSILDLGKLIRQTLADMEENIAASRLIFRLDLPEDPIFIRADGSRMYRVFQNLIKNALQYSLDGSRVFICLSVKEGRAVTEIKNTSRYEINFDADEITERFVRGDASRSTEGSGLGLSIVKTFTSACNGDFSISTDADLFCARLVFPLAPPPEEFSTTEEEHIKNL